MRAFLIFERSFWGDAFADFLAAFLMADNIKKENIFLESYLKANADRKEFTEADEIRFYLYRMYIYTIMAVESYRYGFLYGKIQFYFSKSTAVKCMKKLELIQKGVKA